MKEYFRQNVDEIRDVQDRSFEAHKDTTLPKIADAMHSCLSAGNKIMICGNGGSASESKLTPCLDS
jgi:phosphoheptose isomerase